jgi:hypothetical protein
MNLALDRDQKQTDFLWFWRGTSSGLYVPSSGCVWLWIGSSSVLYVFDPRGGPVVDSTYLAMDSNQ